MRHRNIPYDEEQILLARLCLSSCSVTPDWNRIWHSRPSRPASEPDRPRGQWTTGRHTAWSKDIQRPGGGGQGGRAAKARHIWSVLLDAITQDILAIPPLSSHASLRLTALGSVFPWDARAAPNERARQWHGSHGGAASSLGTPRWALGQGDISRSRPAVTL
ncbi:hypothetical protein P154DRAFT_620064 [Amniculicola lignicola CBS 123094]|uniref:Uncharacterized protein n=1 Tax=Amniculicola lignicola CBS 123094 TaxID=1392246 RepID=A0A6A5WIA6_9PLEO|nr:hypothetical protein P154DRAFT_620064 [Amniculicola lignicola CBS 123094]